MPSISFNKAIQILLTPLAKKHFRTLDEEATVALHHYVASGTGTRELAEDVQRTLKAWESSQASGCRVELNNDVYALINGVAQKNHRSAEAEVAWAICWYASKEALPEETNGEAQD